MQIRELALTDFRNYESETFSFSPGMNVVYGDNGQGKTNLLEAVRLCSTMRLFRTAQKKEGLRFEASTASIRAQLETQQREIMLELRLFRDRSMEIRKNQVRIQRQSDAQGLLRTVLFCPDDLFLLRQGAAARRRFLDAALCQLRPRYARYLEEYQRLYAHKIRILRDWEEKPALLSLWEDFSWRMARFGAQLIRYRAYYIRKLLRIAAQIHGEIASTETLTGQYRTVSAVTDPFAPASQIEQELMEHCLAHKKAELAAKNCLSGPHKDDLILLLNGRSAAAYGSQGQIRTGTLALKLAERELIFEEDNEYPVLLLDDVLSELDRQRQDFVLNRIQKGQVLITCCEDERAKEWQAGAVFHIKNGKII